jgi:dipeptidyl aminopeptidase/acylaminoacyl peptidase
MNRTRLLSLTAIMLSTGVAAATAQQPDDFLTVDLYLEWETVGDPRISPDGSEIIYTRRWVDKVNDRWDSALWIMNADGSRNRFLAEGSNARWSPDGTRIVFTRQGDPTGNQVFVRWMDDEGATSQITHIDESPGSIEWSPDGEWLALTMLVPHREQWSIDMPSAPRGAEWTPAPRIVTRLDYRQDRQGFLADGFRHIFVVPATGGTPRQLTDGNWNHNGPTWTPDGREILFTSLRVEDAEYQWRESDIYAVSVATGDIRQLTTRSGPDGDASISPDGRMVAYSGYDAGDFTWTARKIYVMNIDGSGHRMISGDFDRSPSNLQWSPDGRTVYFNANNHGTTNVYAVSLSDGVRQVTEGNHRLSFENITQNLMAVGTLTSPHEPGDVVAFNLSNPTINKLTDVNGDVLAGKRLGDVEEIWYKSVDDYDVQGWIIKPPDFNPSQQYPMILAIHGGPHSLYGVGFNFGWQTHAAKGYVVLYTNPRGSTGYGSPFANAIKNAYPGKDFDDLMAGVDSVVNRGYIDSDNLFVYGCSGGGVLTSWIVGHTDRFAAASANCPVTNWLSFVGTTDGPSWYRNFENHPWDDPSEHLRRSPLMYVGNVTTPTMLMTGVNDLRTPMPQTEEYYQALKVLKVPTAMIRFNDEWHGTSSRPSNFMRTQLYLLSWFERHSRPRVVSMR